MTPPLAMRALPSNASENTQALAEMRDGMVAMDAEARPTPSAAETAPMLVGRGFSQVARQPGQTLNQRRLMALRAARMEAMRDLAEQIHGLQLDSETRVADAILQEDRLNGVVEGTIRGARTMRINPSSSDTYEVVLGVDRDTVAYMLRALRGQL